MDSLSVFILAGGLGTRLRAVSGERPKGLMSVGGQPFLQRLLERLVAQNLHECALCLGYGAQSISNYFAEHPVRDMALHLSIEAEPRGTAGALRVAQACWAEQNLILNGDTEIAFDFQSFFDDHRTKQGAVTIGLAQVDDAARYGRVLLGDGGRVNAFLEKDGEQRGGLVNAGVYLATYHALGQIPAQGQVSIEHGWLPDLLRRDFSLYGVVIAAEFTDIGAPEDYWRLANRA